MLIFSTLALLPFCYSANILSTKPSTTIQTSTLGTILGLNETTKATIPESDSDLIDTTQTSIGIKSTTSQIPHHDSATPANAVTADPITTTRTTKLIPKIVTEASTSTTKKKNNGAGFVNVHTNNKTGQATVNVQIFNWGWKDLDKLFGINVNSLSHSPRGSIGFIQGDSCPDGWLKYSGSCYWVEHEMLPYDRAQDRCTAKNATLFVANTLDEWDAIRISGPRGGFAWIGLVQFADVPHKSVPLWQTVGGVNPTQLNWVIKPYTRRLDGWSEVSECAAHYNPLTMFDTASFTYYYPCNFNYGSICERNSTILKMMAANPKAIHGYF